MTPAEVVGALRGYLEPGCFADAEWRLGDRHLVVLVGQERIGKRLGGVALLSRMPVGRGITVLPGTVEALAGLGVERCRAYLLPDLKGLDGAQYRTPERGVSRAAGARLRERLAAAGSYLVVTVNALPSRAGDDALPWSPPDQAALFDRCLRSLGGHLHRSAVELALARERALSLASPAKVVAFAERLASDDRPLAV
jgi:hypothetical protein